MLRCSGAAGQPALCFPGRTIPRWDMTRSTLPAVRRLIGGRTATESRETTSRRRMRIPVTSSHVPSEAGTWVIPWLMRRRLRSRRAWRRSSFGHSAHRAEPCWIASADQERRLQANLPGRNTCYVESPVHRTLSISRRYSFSPNRGSNRNLVSLIPRPIPWRIFGHRSIDRK